MNIMKHMFLRTTRTGAVVKYILLLRQLLSRDQVTKPRHPVTKLNIKALAQIGFEISC